MKKSTLLFIVLFVATLVSGQQSQNLQLKIKELQATYSRFTMQTEHITKMKLPLQPVTQKYSLLKNALAVQKLDSIVYQEMDTDTEEWLNLWKDEYLYDSEMKNTAWIEKDWDTEAETWIQSGKVELEFNDAGQVEVMNFQYADETTGELVPETRSVAFYDPEGRLDSIIHYTAEAEDTWVKEGWQVYHYNETGQLVQMDMTVTEVDDEGEYLQGMRFVYTYNEAGQMATDSWYFIDSEVEFLFSKTEYNYDESNMLVSYVDSMSNFVTPELEQSTRTDIEYNTEGDVSVETYSEWDPDNGEWVAVEKDEYTYNDISFSEVIFPSYMQFWGANYESEASTYAIAEVVTSLNLNGEWAPSDRSVFYYSEGTATNTRDLAEAHVSVYPNPATDFITLTWSNYSMLSLEVYHMTGAKVLEQKVSSGMKIPVSGLNNGIYLVKLVKDNQTLYSGKLVKK